MAASNDRLALRWVFKKPASEGSTTTTATTTIYCFVCQVLAMAASNDRLALRWVFKKPASEGGELSPYGVAIALSKQLILKDGTAEI
eukprot:s6374_g2.t1